MRKRNNHVADAIAVFATLVFWFFHTGTYWLFCELQLAILDQYSTMLSVLLSMFTITFVVDKAYTLWSKHRSAGDAKSASEEEQGLPTFWDTLANQSHEFLYIAGGAIGLAVVALWALVPTLWASKQEAVNLSRLEAGEFPDSSWVIIRDARLLWDDSVEVFVRSSSTYTVPVVSHEWRRGQPVVAFASMPANVGNKMANVETIEGMCRITGLGSEIKQLLHKHTDIRVSNRNLLVEHGTDPGKRLTIGLIVGALSIAAGITSVIFFRDDVVPQHTPTETAGGWNEAPGGALDTSATLAAATEVEPEEPPDAVGEWLRERGLNYDQPVAAGSDPDTSDP